MLAKRTSGLCELNVHEEGSQRQVQGKLGEGCVEVVVVLFKLNFPFFTKLVLVELQDNEDDVCAVRGEAHEISAADFDTIKANDRRELRGYG